MEKADRNRPFLLPHDKKAIVFSGAYMLLSNIFHVYLIFNDAFRMDVYRENIGNIDSDILLLTLIYIIYRDLNKKYSALRIVVMILALALSFVLTIAFIFPWGFLFSWILVELIPYPAYSYAKYITISYVGVLPFSFITGISMFNRISINDSPYAVMYRNNRKVIQALLIIAITIVYAFALEKIAWYAGQCPLCHELPAIPRIDYSNEAICDSSIMSGQLMHMYIVIIAYRFIFRKAGKLTDIPA